jgi:hypothetical protein
MSGSQNKETLLSIYKDKRSVVTLANVAMLTGETDFASLNSKLNYYVRSGKLYRPRKGMYVKEGYKPEELCCLLYTPSYISLEYVLQRAGVVFQYDERITAVSYLSRTIEIEERTYSYRKIKGEILAQTIGIRQIGEVNMATPERAFLDILYLDKNYYFDNLNALDKGFISKLLPIYGSQTLNSKVEKIMKDGQYKQA